MRGLVRAIVTFVWEVHHARHDLSIFCDKCPSLHTAMYFRPHQIQIRFSLRFSFSCVTLRTPFPWSYTEWGHANLPLATTMTAVRCTSDADWSWLGSPFSWWKVQSTKCVGGGAR